MSFPKGFIAAGISVVVATWSVSTLAVDTSAVDSTLDGVTDTTSDLVGGVTDTF
jgi:hypothetical protein